MLGRVYKYFLSQFASAEGKKGGEFYTPRCVVKLLVEMTEPYQGRIYYPCCGSSGMFVQSVEFIRAHATGPVAWVSLLSGGGKCRLKVLREAHQPTLFRVLTRFVQKYTLRVAPSELGGVDFDLAVEDDVLPLDGTEMTKQGGIEGQATVHYNLG